MNCEAAHKPSLTCFCDVVYGRFEMLISHTFILSTFNILEGKLNLLREHKELFLASSQALLKML